MRKEIQINLARCCQQQHTPKALSPLQNGQGYAQGYEEGHEGEEVDDEGCGVDTQQSEDAAVTVKHHPLSYWVDHTTGTIIVDKDFNQRVWWGDTDWNAEMVLEDILYLLEE